MTIPESNKEWIAWGEKDPLWGVASAPGKERGQPGAWTDEEFYALGAEDFADYLDFWQGYGFTTQACVEIGCGAGRMSKQLSKIFARVDAVDVSPAMIAYARSHVTEDNIAWHVGTGSILPIPTELVTGAFSCHVFQHFSNESVAYAYFKEIWRVLKPGGTVLIHLPLFRHHRNRKFGIVSNALYRTYRAVYQVYGHVARLRMKAGGKLHMHGLSYEERALAKKLAALSFSNIQFRCKWNDSDPLTIVLATKKLSSSVL